LGVEDTGFGDEFFERGPPFAELAVFEVLVHTWLWWSAKRRRPW
jgi:hypothetical protein